MKVVIQTQVSENYGTAEDAYWKFKSGNTFVVPNLTPEQCRKAIETGIPTLRALIEYKNPMMEEYVIDVNVLEDDAKVCEPWDSPTQLFWEKGRWVARQETLNDEYGYMHKIVAKRTICYDMLMGGGEENTTILYTLRDGRTMNHKEINDFLNSQA